MSRDKELGSENGSEIRPGKRPEKGFEIGWSPPVFGINRSPWRSIHWLSVGVGTCGKLDFFCGKLGFLCGKVGRLVEVVRVIKGWFVVPGPNFHFIQIFSFWKFLEKFPSFEFWRNKKFEKIRKICYNIIVENKKGEHENECLHLLLLQN
jgi:hypothetical protein